MFQTPSTWLCLSSIWSFMLVAQLCPTLCDPMDCSPPGSSIPRILQERILEWVAISCSGGSSWSRDQTQASSVSCVGRCGLHHWATWQALFHKVPANYTENKGRCAPFLCTSTRCYKAIKGMPTQYSNNISPSQIWKKTFTGPRFSQNPDVTVNIPRDNLKIAIVFTLKTNSLINTVKKK